MFLFKFEGDLSDIEEEGTVNPAPDAESRVRKSNCLKGFQRPIEHSESSDSDYETGVPRKRTAKGTASLSKKVKFSKCGANEVNLHQLKQMKIMELTTGAKQKNSIAGAALSKDPTSLKTLGKQRPFDLIQELAFVATRAGALKVTNLVSEHENVFITADSMINEGDYVSTCIAFEFVLQAEAELAYANLKYMTVLVVFASAICR